MELIANLTDLKPKASALEATAVFTDNTETNTADNEEIIVVIMPFREAVIPLKFKSFLNEEQTPSAKKQFVIGMKNKLEIKFSPCARIKSVVFTEKDVIVPPEVATIMQNAGKNAKVKSAHNFTVEQQRPMQSVRLVIRKTEMIRFVIVS